MKDEHVGECLNRWEALMGFPISKAAKPNWVQYLSSLAALDAHTKICHIIDDIADHYATDEKAKRPGLAQVKAMYRKAKVHNRVIKDTAGCNACHRKGFVYLVVGYDVTINRYRPVPRYTVIPAPNGYVWLTPCNCEKGLTVNDGWNIPGVQKAYTPQQLHSLAEYTYTYSNVDRGKNPEYIAHDWRQMCETYYHGGKTDQTIGYDAKQQPVRGFLPDQRYNQEDL